MKKIIYLYVSCFLLMLAGCSDDLSIGRAVKGNTELQVSIEGDTRASIDLSGKTVWSKGDEISVYTTLGRFQTFVLEGDGGNKAGKFIGYLDNDEEVDEYAVYPAGNHRVGNGMLQVNMPKAYDFHANDVKMPLMAKLSKGATSIAFTHVGGLLSYTIKNVPSTAKGFMLVVDTKRITGDFTPSDGVIKANEMVGKDTVVLKLKEDPTSEMTFHVPVPTGIYDSFTVALTNADGNAISTTVKHSTLANAVAAGRMVKMPAYKILGPDFYVKPDGTGDGSSWDDAMSGDKFREMVNSNTFSNGDVVYMAEGTYYTGSTANVNDQNVLTDHLKFRSGITIYGGFPANSTGKAHKISYPSAGETIFSADLNHNGKPDEGDCHIMHLEMNGQQTISFNGISFKGGYLGRVLSDQVRAGVYVSGDGTNARFNYCKFHDNVSTISGGNTAGGSAIGMWRGSVTLYRCEVSGNKAHDRGGAMRLISNSPKLLIDQCLFYNNSTDGEFGGCIQGSAPAGTIVINNSTFFNNTTGSNGGSINGSSMMYISNSTFVNNACPNDPQDFRTEGSEKHYCINSIIVGSESQMTGNRANIYVNNNSFTSEGYTVYGAKGGAGTFYPGKGDVPGSYTEGLFGTPTLADNGGATLMLKPLRKINGASLDELKTYKQKYKNVIPESFDVTVDQRGQKRQNTTTVGAFEVN